MLFEGTVIDGTIVLDDTSEAFPNGTRVSVAAVTGMEPAIRKTPGVCGGTACVGRRRIPVWKLVEVRRFGHSDGDIQSAFGPPLTGVELAHAWAYAASHPGEIDRAIPANDEA